jgi:hypothetical protein
MSEDTIKHVLLNGRIFSIIEDFDFMRGQKTDEDVFIIDNVKIKIAGQECFDYIMDMVSTREEIEIIIEYNNGVGYFSFEAQIGFDGLNNDVMKVYFYNKYSIRVMRG